MAGAAKIKQASAKALAFAKSNYCIFCGGVVEGNTVDHCPPRSIFVNREWPENFVFPACVACNAGSREAENVLGFLTRLYSAKEGENEVQEFEKYVKTLQANYPQEMRQMTKMPISARRQFVRQNELALPPGTTHLDIPIVHIPGVWVDLVEGFGAKLTKGIHFHETGRICPPESDVWSYMIPNAAEFKTPFAPEILQAMGRMHNIVRSNKDLSDQFGYLTERTVDGSAALYVYQFNQSFKLMCFYHDDGHVVREVAQKWKQGGFEAQ